MGFSLKDIGNFLKSPKFRNIAQQITGLPVGSRGDEDAEDYEAPGGMPPLPGPIIKNIAPPSEFDPTRQLKPVAFSAAPSFGDAADGGTAIPPPRRLPPPDLPPPVAPDTTAPIPPPRINVGEPPPPPEPKFIADMEQLRANLPQPTYKDGRAVFNDRNPAIPPPRMMPTEAPTVMVDAAAPSAPPIPPPQMRERPWQALKAEDLYGSPTPSATKPIPPPASPVFMGERTTATMTPAEKAAAHVQALQRAGSQSKVRETPEGYEIEPPHKMGRLKAMGKGFLLRMLAGAPYGPGGMIGAGLSGTVEGAVAPGHVQSSLRQNEIARAQGDQATAQQLERGQIANRAAQVGVATDEAQLKNMPEDRQRRIEAENAQRTQAEVNDWQQQVAQLDKVPADDPNRPAYLAALQKEAERLSQKAGRQITLIPGEGREPLRMAVDGQIVERNKDGSWKSVFGSPKLDRTDENYDEKTYYDWSVKNTENDAKRTAAMQAAAAAESTAADHQKKVTAIAGQISVLDAQMGQMSSRDPQLGPLKRQREQLKQQQAAEESGMNTAYKERDKAKAEAAAVPAIPPPPKRARRATAGLTIEGAIEHFKTVRKREPNAQEIANMRAALQN